MKKYRFFYHFNKQTRKMTLHWRGRCIPIDLIQCYEPCETKYNKRQPYLVMQGWASKVYVGSKLAVIGDLRDRKLT